jgi:hypothetical protein
METIDLSLDRPQLIKNNYRKYDGRVTFKKHMINEIITPLEFTENNQKNPLSLQLPENCPLDNSDIFDYPQIYRSSKVSSKDQSDSIDKLQESKYKIDFCNKRFCNIM